MTIIGFHTAWCASTVGRFAQLTLDPSVHLDQRDVFKIQGWTIQLCTCIVHLDQQRAPFFIIQGWTFSALYSHNAPRLLGRFLNSGVDFSALYLHSAPRAVRCFHNSGWTFQLYLHSVPQPAGRFHKSGVDY